MTDWAAWVTAGGTLLIGAGGIGAFWYAKGAYETQRKQFRLTRTPYPEVALDWQGDTSSLQLTVRLGGDERVIKMSVAIANPDEWPMRFTEGHGGVKAEYVGLMSPGDHVGWVMTRKRDPRQYAASWPGALSFRVEGLFTSEEPWSRLVDATLKPGAVEWIKKTTDWAVPPNMATAWTWNTATGEVIPMNYPHA